VGRSAAPFRPGGLGRYECLRVRWRRPARLGSARGRGHSDSAARSLGGSGYGLPT
jgi:hypothetical protein